MGTHQFFLVMVWSATVPGGGLLREAPLRWNILVDILFCTTTMDILGVYVSPNIVKHWRSCSASYSFTTCICPSPTPSLNTMIRSGNTSFTWRWSASAAVIYLILLQQLLKHLVVVFEGSLKAHFKPIHDFLPLTLNDHSGVPTTHVPIHAVDKLYSIKFIGRNFHYFSNNFAEILP